MSAFREKIVEVPQEEKIIASEFSALHSLERIFLSRKEIVQAPFKEIVQSPFESFCWQFERFVD